MPAYVSILTASPIVEIFSMARATLASLSPVGSSPIPDFMYCPVDSPETGARGICTQCHWLSLRGTC